MSVIEVLTDLANRNRLLTVLTFIWLLISNALYFSLINEGGCYKPFESALSAPEWVSFWKKYTINYIDLYVTTFDHPFADPTYTCETKNYYTTGHFSFMLLPIVIYIGAICSIKWVIVGNKK
jgi:hypothetical protein